MPPENLKGVALSGHAPHSQSVLSEGKLPENHSKFTPCSQARRTRQIDATCARSILNMFPLSIAAISPAT
jgi:hypothetical protein